MRCAAPTRRAKRRPELTNVKAATIQFVQEHHQVIQHDGDARWQGDPPKGDMQPIGQTS